MLSSRVWNSAGCAAFTGAERLRMHTSSAIAATQGAARMMQECAEPMGMKQEELAADRSCFPPTPRQTCRWALQKAPSMRLAGN